MQDVKEIYEEVTRQAPFRPGAFERQRKRQARHTRNRKIGVFAVAAAIAGLAFLAIRVSAGDGGNRPATPADTGPSVTGTPEVDYVIDLDTGETTPLPDAILGLLELPSKSSRDRCVAQYRLRCSPQYATSSDGTLLAYVGVGADGTPQIFIAGVDGSGVRQVTRAPEGASSPAWSPDGTKIAYNGGRGLFVQDVANGETTLVTREVKWWTQVEFMPDGESLLYDAGPDERATLRTVPLAGGRSTILFTPGGGIKDAFNGSISPDGSLVTFLGSGFPEGEDGDHCGPCRFVARVDGTERRMIPGWGSDNPSGTWSPDGTRIVCGYADDSSGSGVIVVDVATGEFSRVAKGGAGIWLDDHTLLVEV